MIQKKYCVVVAAIVYVALIFLYFKKANVKSEEPCESIGFLTICIRFCCQNKINCNENFVRDNFNKSHLPQYLFDYDFEDSNKTEDYKVLLGKPHCSLRSQEFDIKKTDFLSVSNARAKMFMLKIL